MDIGVKKTDVKGKRMPTVEKASDFLKYAGIEKPDSYQRTKFSELRNRLAALGLDPMNTKGLTYRALVYDNKARIEHFLSLLESKKDTKGLGRQLKNVGIDISKPQELHRILASIKVKAKEVAKLKDAEHINYNRQAYEAECDRTLAEVAEEERLAEEARAKREQLSNDSFQTWLSDAVATATAAATT